MSSLRHLYRALLYYSGLAAFCVNAGAQGIVPQAGEYSLLESIALRGDQSVPDISINSTGGYVTWHDNAIDGHGQGVGARYLDSTFSPGLFGSFRVNNQTLGDQVRPQVATLASGGAAFVWEGGSNTVHNVFIRFLTASRVFATSNEIRVNIYTNGNQSTPAVAALPNGNVVVAWNSYGQDGNMQGIFARILNPNGQFVTAPFQVNQYTNLNQRNPSLAVSTNGTIAIAWISEHQLNANSVDVVHRRFNSSGQPLSDELRVNAATALCANPSVLFRQDGGLTFIWAQRTTASDDGWDVFVRNLASDGTGTNAPMVVNTYRYGAQYAPRIATLGNRQLVVWTSFGEDGWQEGVYGRMLTDGIPAGESFLVNTGTINKQINPVVGNDGSNHFVVVWASFTGVANGFDLFAQRYTVGELPPTPPAPLVSALWSSSLSVSWPTLSGYAVNRYEIYMDEAEPPAAPTGAVTNGNRWIANGLAPQSTHSFRLAYVLENGLRSPLSPLASGITWGEDRTGADGVPDGLPDDWQSRYWGYKAAEWARANEDSDGDGVSNIREFLAGTNPINALSVLKTWLTWNRFGRVLNWNTEPGLTYQVQVSTDLGIWTDFGAVRFAAGTSDGLGIAGTRQAEYFRVIRIR